MKVLIIAATSGEFDPIKKKLEIVENSQSTTFNSLQLDFLVTGVGMTATAFAMGKHLQKKQYDLAINIGIAGAFDRTLNLGEVVEVQSDFMPEMGAEDDSTFITVHELGLIGENEFPFKNGKIIADTANLPKHALKKVDGVTVNKVHGNEASIVKFRHNFNAAVESMEGAAFLYACKMMSVDCIQFRGISNYVEKRNKAAWQIERALDNLSNELYEFLIVIEKKHLF